LSSCGIWFAGRPSDDKKFPEYENHKTDISKKPVFRGEVKGNA